MEQNIGFNLIGIKTEQFAIIEKAYSKDQETQFSVGLQFKIDQKYKQVGVYLTFSFEQNKNVFLTIEVSGHFKIKKESWNNFIKEDKISFPQNFMAHLTMLIVGTARGVLHAKTDDSPFNKFLIPTINVTELVKEDVQFILEV